MSGINLILVGLSLFGFLPLGIYIYKMRRVKRILAGGYPTKASVYHVQQVRGKAQIDIVYYNFIARDGKQYTGKLTIEPGKYRVNDPVDIFYLPLNPKRNTVKGAWGSPIMFVFLLLLALFVLFAAYKIYEMVQTGYA